MYNFDNFLFVLCEFIFKNSQLFINKIDDVFLTFFSFLNKLFIYLDSFNFTLTKNQSICKNNPILHIMLNQQYNEVEFF